MSMCTVCVLFVCVCVYLYVRGGLLCHVRSSMRQGGRDRKGEQGEREREKSMQTYTSAPPAQRCTFERETEEGERYIEAERCL